MNITVAIPSIPPRSELLARAIQSVQALDFHRVAGLSIAFDLAKEGSAVTRNRALAGSHTEFTAFLDDDDEYLSFHMRKLYACLVENEADAVYSLPVVMTPYGEIPRRLEWGGGPEFDPDYLRIKSHLPTNSLVRTELAKDVGGFVFVKDPGSELMCDDYGFWLRLLNAGAKIVHLHEPTFIWHHWGGNTSGLPARW